ncbi:MAG: type VII secretion protein EccC, partial [Nocardioides sp.]
VRTRAPGRAQLVVLDPRRTLLGELPDDHLLHYAASATEIVTAIGAVAEALGGRLPPADVTPRALRDRSWWTGPEVFVLADDYQLLAADSPLRPLLALLPYSREVGLHLVLSRCTAGLAPGLHDPVVTGLRECGASTVLLSGNPEEGPVAGVHRLRPAVPGRARLIGPDGVRRLQLAWKPPRDLVSPA